MPCAKLKDLAVVGNQANIVGVMKIQPTTHIPLEIQASLILDKISPVPRVQVNVTTI